MLKNILLSISLALPIVTIADTSAKSESLTAAVPISSNFLLGRWKSEEYKAYGTTIPSQVYVFTKSEQGVEGMSMKMAVKSYLVKGNEITVQGGISQIYKVIDKNTVSYEIPNVGTKKLSRL